MSDPIERQDAIDAIERITSSMSVCVNTDECHGMKRMQRQAVIELANLPSAQQERKKGKWIKDEEQSANHVEPIFICSSCRNYEAWGLTECTRYCPNCGSFNGGEE